MGRKKEPQRLYINQKRIITVAKELFTRQGIENTKIDDVAKKAGMSKSTLYVYFRSKEEIVNYISLEAMNYLYFNMKELLLQQSNDDKAKFMEICNFFVDWKKQYPLSFQLLVEEIPVDTKLFDNKKYIKDIFDTGEKLNEVVFSYIKDNMMKDKSLTSLELKEITMFLWATIYGIILLADNKEKYIMKAMGITKKQYLDDCFCKLYKTVLNR